MVEWVEVRGKSVEVAIAAGMQELGIENRDGVDVEVIQEPERGFLGLGGKDAVVRVKPRATGRNRRRKRGRGEAGDRSEAVERRVPPNQRAERGGRGGTRPPAGEGGNRDEGRRSMTRGGTSGSRGSAGRVRSSHPAEGRPDGGQDRGRTNATRQRRQVSTADAQAQAPMVEEFLNGLLDSFGLDGSVTVGVDDDVILATIEGEQTEALVGPRGSVMEAIHEITKTVLHRHVVDTARVRIDIAGYAERRRQALSIYASQLIDQVLAEGGEIMLEPMSASDRKVIHDAVGARDGVESYSEGEPPRRYVVIATRAEGSEGTGTVNDDEDVDEDEPSSFT